jgi:hypothetical protein
MNKLLLTTIPLTLLVTGCMSTNPDLIETRYLAVVPPAAMYKCPVVKKNPSGDTLTDIDVGNFVVKLYKNNWTCKHSIDAIKAFETKAAKDLEPTAPY